MVLTQTHRGKNPFSTENRSIPYKPSATKFVSTSNQNSHQPSNLENRYPANRSNFDAPALSFESKGRTSL